MRNERNNTPLHEAAYAGNTDVIKLLLVKGAEIDARCDDQSTPLNLAALGNKLDAVRILLETGANPNAGDEFGDTALHWAIDSEEIVSLLLSFGANPNIMNTSFLQTPLEMAKNDKIVRILKEKGADITKAIDVNGNSKLHYAANNGDIQQITYLMRHGTNINLQNFKGQTPLHIAAIKGSYKVVENLIENGANKNITDNEGMVPYNYAIRNGCDDVLELLKNRSIGLAPVLIVLAVIVIFFVLASNS